MKVTFITLYFPPEVGAPQTRIWTFATRLVQRGHGVMVVTGFPHYPSGIVLESYRGKFFLRETLNGLRVLRGWAYTAPNTGFFRRVLDQGSFALSALPVGLVAERPDVIVVESPPLFSGWPAYLLGLLRGVPFVFYVSDLWPDSAIEMGVLKNRWVIGISRWMEELFYRKSDRIVAVTRGIQNSLLQRGFPSPKIALITNGVDSSRFSEIGCGDWRQRWNTGERFLALYAGTHGMAQGLDSVLEAAALLRNEPVQFVFVGEGGEKKNLKAMASKLELGNVLFADAVPSQDMPSVLASADCCVVSLRALKVFEGAVPSKIYEAMAAGKPIVLAAEGEAPEVLRRAKAGIPTSPGNAGQIAEALRTLMRDPGQCRRLGENGRSFVMENYDFEVLTSRLEGLLQDIVRSRAELR